jgi:hypothetical protein
MTPTTPEQSDQPSKRMTQGHELGLTRINGLLQA